MSFAELGLVPELLRAVAEQGYTTATPIQLQAIPAVLADRDVLAGAQTGTGKTAAFILPILQKLGAPPGRTPRVLVLTPTRELAAQIAESARAYGKYLPFRTLVVFGGVNIKQQILNLRGGCDILVATPGRLLDLADQGAVELRAAIGHEEDGTAAGVLARIELSDGREQRSANIGAREARAGAAGGDAGLYDLAVLGERYDG